MGHSTAPLPALNMRRHIIWIATLCKGAIRAISVCMQVQDVGLIFLSAMATSIAVLCEQQGYSREEALGTSLITLAISTFLVGFFIVLLGEAA